MNTSLLGGQICKFRKAQNMTQEDLGRAVGVSTQAVSRWECGGAPDIALLPAIADTLHVPIDALFGREGGEYVDVKRTVARYMASLPREQLLDAMMDLTWTCIPAMLVQDYGISDVGPMKHAEIEFQGDRCLSKSIVASDAGLLMGSFARDLRFMLAFPEPEEGYARFFSDNETYRSFFAALARPYALETVLELAGEDGRYMSAAAVRKRLGIGPEETERVRALEETLEALHAVNLFSRDELELEEGVIHTYCFRRQEFLPFFLLLARYLTQHGELNYIGGLSRERPWLRKTKEKEEKSHENR